MHSLRSENDSINEISNPLHGALLSESDDNEDEDNDDVIDDDSDPDEENFRTHSFLSDSITTEEPLIPDSESG